MSTRQSLDAVTAALDRVSTLVGAIQVAWQSRPAASTMQAATTPSWFGANSAPKPTANSPVVLVSRRSERACGSPIEEGFAISGVNSSDQDLSQVHATLKPDGSWREIALGLKVEGRAASNAVIPAGARFSFGSDATDDAKPSAGAILTFRYVIAGQQKAAIVYLSAATIARFASRE